MLHLAGGKALSVNVRDFLELECAFQSNGIVDPAAKEEKILCAVVLLGQVF